MGNKQIAKNPKNSRMSNSRNRQMNNSMSCQDDMMCKNIDSNRSTVDKLVYVCPNATCNGGNCDCGPGCEKDPYTGMCCSKVIKEVVNGQTYTYCIEDPYKGNKETKCKIPDQKINGVVISGKDICDIYNKYN
jgi:hypothetical protein